MGSIGWTLTREALVLSYGRRNNAGDIVPQTERLWLTRTATGFGGEREWLRCSCGRRCRVVYCQDQGTRCRVCYRLAYQSQRESAGTRAMSMASKVVRKLGGRGDYCDDFPDKPKGMHWRTYWNLEARHHQLMNYADADMMNFILDRFG